MIYDYNLLYADEIKEFKGLLQRYRGYDILDMFMEMLITDPVEFFKRKKKESKSEESTIDIMSEDLKFCDGDKCFTPPILN